MPLPWVSRELYDRVCEELKRSEAERLKLLNHALGTPDPIQMIANALPAPDSREAEDLLNTATGEISAVKLRQMAQDAANKRAGRG